MKVNPVNPNLKIEVLNVGPNFHSEEISERAMIDRARALFPQNKNPHTLLSFSEGHIGSRAEVWVNYTVDHTIESLLSPESFSSEDIKILCRFILSFLTYSGSDEIRLPPEICIKAGEFVILPPTII